MTRRLTPSIVLAAVALILTGCSTPEPDEPSTPRVRTVQTQPVRPLAEVTARQFSGTLRAPLETNLSFRVPGQVTAVHVDVGSRVQAGDVIARLDAADYRLEVEAAAAAYRQARAAAENARAELRRIKALYADDNASLSAYDRARTTFETTQNRAQAAQRQVELARKRLGYTELTAPAAGSIADKRVEAGENVAVGQPVMRLTSGQRLEVQVQVPEDQVTQIQVGQRARVHASLVPDEGVPATVTEVAAAPGGQRPTYPVVVTLDAPASTLRSGMTARVAFDRGETPGLVVPAEAVSQDDAGRFVYVVAPDTAGTRAHAGGRIERRAVQTRALTSHGLVVTDGLQPGDRVVTAGIAHVRDGDPVRIARLLSNR